MVVVDDTEFLPLGLRLEDIFKVEYHPEILDPVWPCRIYRFSFSGNRPGVKAEVWSNFTLERCRSEALGIGQVVWEFPDEFQRVAETQSRTTIAAEVFFMVWAWLELPPMEIDELLKGMANGLWVASGGIF